MRQRISALGAVLLFGLIPLGAVGFFTVEQSRMSEQLEEERLEGRNARVRMTSALALEITLGNLERGQRGYLLTGERGYLEPYEHGIAQFSLDLDAFERAMSDSAEDRETFAALKPYIQVKLDEMSSSLGAYERGGLAAALPIIRSNVGDATMHSIRDALEGLVARDRETMASASRRIALDIARGNELVLLGFFIAIGSLGIASGVIYVSYLRHRTSAASLQATLDTVREGVSAFDRHRRVVAWNQSFVRLLKLPEGFLKVGRRAEEVEALDRQRAVPVVGDLLTLDAEARRGARPLLIERTTEDDRVVELYHAPDSDGGFVTSLLDVTEARQTEEKLRQAQRMEILGQLTAGVAHDFNNLLTIIVGNLARLEAVFPAETAHGRLVRDALRGADRATMLIGQLLAFGRRQPLQPKPMNIGQLMPDLVQLLRRTLGERIEIVLPSEHATAEQATLWNALVDPAQFESAVLNLALNARDAMPGPGGRLTLEVGNVTFDEAYATRHAELLPGDYVMLAVTDTGSGMPPEVLARVFDPFFTTKRDGLGSGLGLSMVYGFVKQSNGHVTIYSEVGHGTTVKLYFPRSREALEDAGSTPSAGVELTGDETILVVEDDEDVRETVSLMLGDLGYTVLQAPDGPSAIDLFRRRPDIDLLFTDVVMPGGLNGRDVADAAVSLYPGLKVLFTSGYTENAIVQQGRVEPTRALLSKPYRREQLASKIRATLDA